MALKRIYNTRSIFGRPLVAPPNTFHNRAKTGNVQSETYITPADRFKALRLAETSLNNSPIVAITIDHLDSSKPDSALALAQKIVNKGVPVTVFVQCSGGVGICSDEDKKMIRALHGLNTPGKKLVELGIHYLETEPNEIEAKKRKEYAKKHNKENPPQKERQLRNNENLIAVITKVTGAPPRVASYHGTGIEPEKIPQAAGIAFTRGTSTAPGNHNNTPRNNNSPEGVYRDVIRKWNAKGNMHLASTFFFHPNELTTHMFLDDLLAHITNPQMLSDKKGKGIRYRAMLYYDAMKFNYNK